MRQTIFLLVFLSLYATGCGSSNPTTSPKTNSSQQVLAWVGQTVITLQEFNQAYQQSKKDVSPQKFLQSMVRSRMILLEAQERKLGDSKAVESNVRKALVRSLLRRDFERWFTADSINILLVNKYYNDNIKKYYQPKLVQAVHVLVRKALNPSRRRKMIPSEKKQIEQVKKEILERAQKMKAFIHKANPKNAIDFLKTAAAFAKLHNTANPQLVSWFKKFKASGDAQKGQSPLRLVKALRNVAKELNNIPFCGNCLYMRHRLIIKDTAKWLKKFRKQKQVPEKYYQKLLKKIRSEAFYKRGLVIAENLGRFPKGTVRGWPSMVEPFAVGAFALKDGHYSKKLVKTKFGYHIIFKMKTFPMKNIPLLRAAPEIRRILFQKMQPQKYKQWLQLKYKTYNPVGYLSRLRSKRNK